MFIDASFGALLLEPLFRLQESSNYTIPYGAPDLGVSRIYMNFSDTIFRSSALGSNYPNVSGSNSNHSQGVERSYF